MIFVDWKYVVEIEGGVIVEVANSEFEFDLVEKMAAILFANCPTTRIRRKLQDSFGISAMDGSPADEKMEIGGMYLLSEFHGPRSQHNGLRTYRYKYGH
jgi:hypothetical protein